jgi:threonine/homoserine efflux transporter RhtA
MYAARSQGNRHRYAYTGVRIAAGSWNLLLGIFLVSHGYQWGAVLFAVSALIFWAAYILAPGRSGSRSNGQS